MPRITGLFLYPVKSLRGCVVPQAEMDELGLVGDRRFLVVDPQGKHLTQRSLPRMARISTRLADNRLTLSTEESGSFSVPTTSDPAAALRVVSVWNSEGLRAEDCGEKVSAWLSNFLGLTCYLVRIGPAFVRPVLKSTARPGDLVTFADAFPFLLISEASLATLNDRIVENHGEPVPMNRFRPNFVIDGCDAFAEDSWSRVRIGQTVFRNGGPCARCIMTTTDQLTGERGHEPLKTLASFRRDPQEPSSVNFGSNLIHESKHGRVQLGDVVNPLA
jgi:uncharacterized protein